MCLIINRVCKCGTKRKIKVTKKTIWRYPSHQTSYPSGKIKKYKNERSESPSLVASKEDSEMKQFF